MGGPIHATHDQDKQQKVQAVDCQAGSKQRTLEIGQKFTENENLH